LRKAAIRNAMINDPRNERVTSETIRIDLDMLGMEARSVFRSIRTEQNKLTQSGQVSRTDLSYFHARYNYYKLSLMRLDPIERQILEPVLGMFREKLAAWETGSAERPQPTAFLTPVEKPVAEKPVVEKPAPAKIEVAEEEDVVELPKNEMNRDAILAELDLISIALSAEASNQRNATIKLAVDRIRKLF